MEAQVQTETKAEGFDPIIVAYCCQWCSYAAADLAGNMRIQYPSNIRILRVPCTGRVDTLYLLKTFEAGADGVFISGCLPGDCHYLNGNDKCQKRVNELKKVLDKIGVGADRLEMYYNSAAMGPQFARTCIEFVDRINKLGPWKEGPGVNTAQNIAAGL